MLKNVVIWLDWTQVSSYVSSSSGKQENFILLLTLLVTDLNV